ANLLEDERSRQVLIEQLRELAGETPATSSAAEEGAERAAAPEPRGGTSAAGAAGSATTGQGEASGSGEDDPLGGVAGALQAFAAGMAHDFSQTAGMLR